MKIMMLSHDPKETVPFPIELECTSEAIKKELGGWFTTLNLGKGFVGYYRTDPSGLDLNCKMVGEDIFGTLLISKLDDQSLSNNEISHWTSDLSGIAIGEA
jgi:hypothetical protein